jgi:hypothetical protein
MKILNENHTMHQHNFQVGIIVHINYRHNPIVDPIDPNSTIIKKVCYYIFNDLNHDSLYVQHAFMFHWSLCVERCVPKQHIVWTGGYLDQF